MKALVYKGPREVVIEEVDDPKINDPRDVIIKVTSAAICGSDLHMYEGRTIVKPGTVLGHEIMGVIEEVGEGVHSVKVGDRVVLPFNIGCGYCFNCTRGKTSACLIPNPEHAGAGYGYAGMGPYRGGQAEKVLVPFADFNCIKLPGKAGDEHEDDFLMLADIFPTAYYANELAKVEPGGSVAIYGSGPVGLLAVHSAHIRGAAEIYIVDESETRRAKAEEFGAIGIDPKAGDPAKQIMDIRKKNKEIQQMWLPEELDKMPGVMSGIDAIGYQAHSFKDWEKEDSTAVLNQLAELVNPTGAIGIIGVFMPEDPGASTEDLKKGIIDVPLGKFWNKGLQVGMGQTPVKHFSIVLRNLIVGGIAHPGDIVSHHISLDEAPEAYRLFDMQGIDEGSVYTKVVINP